MADEFDRQHCQEEAELYLVRLMRLLFQWYASEEGKSTRLESILKQAYQAVSDIYGELWVEVHGDEFREVMKGVMKK